MAKKSNSVKRPRTIDDIINEIKKKSSDGDYIYRGERKKHKKVSSSLYREYFDRKDIHIDIEGFDMRDAQRQIFRIARNHIGESPRIYEDFIKDIEVENDLAKSFAECSALISQLIFKETEELEILTELQHYGGKTNLIDFTTDYLIAIFFACSGCPKNVGRVILLEKDDEIKKMIIRPQNPRHRVISQKSVFLYPPRGYIEVSKNHTVFIPTKFKQPLLEYLRKYHNISAETIYNDIHGFIRNESIHSDAFIEFYQGYTLHMKGVKAKTHQKRQQTLKQAIKHYDVSLRLNPEFEIVYVNRGECWLHVEEWDKAKKDLIIGSDMGMDIIDSFHNDYENVAEFEKKTGFKMPEDLAEMLGG